jgi:hypothetical protein
MSIASEISRLQTAKADLETAIEAKGVTIPADTSLSDFDTYVGQISTGGSSSPGSLIIDARTVSTTGFSAGDEVLVTAAAGTNYQYPAGSILNYFDSYRYNFVLLPENYNHDLAGYNIQVYNSSITKSGYSGYISGTSMNYRNQKNYTTSNALTFTLRRDGSNYFVDGIPAVFQRNDLSTVYLYMRGSSGVIDRYSFDLDTGQYVNSVSLTDAPSPYTRTMVSGHAGTNAGYLGMYTTTSPYFKIYKGDTALSNPATVPSEQIITMAIGGADTSNGRLIVASSTNLWVYSINNTTITYLPTDTSNLKTAIGTLSKININKIEYNAWNGDELYILSKNKHSLKIIKYTLSTATFTEIYSELDYNPVNNMGGSFGVQSSNRTDFVNKSPTFSTSYLQRIYFTHQVNEFFPVKVYKINCSDDTVITYTIGSSPEGDVLTGMPQACARVMYNASFDITQLAWSNGHSNRNFLGEVLKKSGTTYSTPYHVKKIVDLPYTENCNVITNRAYVNSVTDSTNLTVSLNK